MIYTDGVITLTAGSPVVTGAGTQWKKNVHGVAPGQLISIENGTVPLCMLVRAVNSDTELVLSFDAPVTLSEAKYAIATTIPDSISDAARTLSSNQYYITYFLRIMQQWMSGEEPVEVVLPNGQRVTLRGLKEQETAPGGGMPEGFEIVQVPGQSETAVMSQKAVTDLTGSLQPGDNGLSPDTVFGFGQSMTDVSSQRRTGVTYKNDTGRLILVSLTLDISLRSASGGFITLGAVPLKFTNGTVPPNDGMENYYSMTFAVMPGLTYTVSTACGISRWWEYR